MDDRFALVRVLNGLGDALPVPESPEFYRKAYRAAGDLPGSARNVREPMTRAAVTSRWSRWSASAPAAERQRQLGAALRAWQTLLACAPDTRSAQAALADVRQSLVAVRGRGQ